MTIIHLKLFYLQIIKQVEEQVKVCDLAYLKQHNPLVIILLEPSGTKGNELVDSGF